MFPSMRHTLALRVLPWLSPFFTACAGGDGLIAMPEDRWPPDRPGYASPVPAENRHPGDGTVLDGVPALPAGELEGYLDRVSARAGDTVTVHVASRTPGDARWSLHRLGWYAGDRSRQVLEGGTVPVAPNEPCATDAATGLLRCAWPASFSFAVPADAVSGLHLVRIERLADGLATVIPLVVVDDRPADLVVLLGAASAQAYNAWGGRSFYPDPDAPTPVLRADAVSFDRPYATEGGGGDLLRYDVPLIRFLEKHDYDVTYVTDLDVARGDAAALLRRGALVIGGRDVYWSGEERRAIEDARDGGLPLLFLTGMAGHWKARFEDPSPAGELRTVVCYKERPAEDPVPGDVTGRFRDPPISWPENALAGAMFTGDSILAHPWVVQGASHFLYEGTGLAEGEAIPSLIGGGHDRSYRNGQAPPGLDTVARSPVLGTDGEGGVAEATIGRVASGALVFDAGSLYFSRGLAVPQVRDPRVERMTANLIRAAIGVPVPPRVGRDPARPRGVAEGPYARAVRTVARGLASPAGLAALPDGSLAVAEAGGNRISLLSPSGTVRAVAGAGEAGFVDAPGSLARFWGPTGIAAAPDGTLFVADTGNHCLRRISARSPRSVTTLAGRCGDRGLADGASTLARFFRPQGILFEPASGRLYVADTGNDRIATVDPATGEVATVAIGRGSADGAAGHAGFRDPTGLAATGDGGVVVVDSGNARLRLLAGGRVSTLAGVDEGFGDGRGDAVRLAPQGAAAWDGGAVIFADPPSYRVRRAIPGDPAVVHTLAGGGPGEADGPGEAALLGLPAGVAVGADGTIYVSDGLNGAVRAIER
jgi:DNA-binding beta-propeller fold protein YncE